MQYTVSITSQGQISIPSSLRRELKIDSPSKAVISRVGDRLIIEPKADFSSLAGSMKSDTALTDTELKEAKNSFSSSWAEK